MKRLFFLLAWLGAFLVCFAVRPAAAQLGGGHNATPRQFPHIPSTPGPSPAGPAKIRLTVDNGDRGPVVLTRKSSGYAGEFVVWNDGQGPLTISRIAMRGDDDDPRLPQRFRVRFSEGSGTSTVVQPHTSKRVEITWIPDREPKVRQAVGHVVLTSNDESAGEVAMGILAPDSSSAGWLTRHLLTWLLLVPGFGALAALVMGIVGYTKDETMRRLAMWLTGLECLLVVVLHRGFNGTVVRADGNDGFQCIERAVLLPWPGVEYFVGVDGASIAPVILTALVGFLGTIASERSQAVRAIGRPRAYYGLYLLLLTSILGVLVSLDLCMLVAWWVVMLASLTGLARLAEGTTRRTATRRLAWLGTVSCVLLVLGAGALFLRSDPTYLGDGARVEHTFALPELMRVAYNAKHLEILGCSWVKVVWSALFVAFALIIPLVPAHSWLVAFIARAPAPVAALATAGATSTGVYGMLRVLVAVLPDGSRWAATTIVVLGAVNVVAGALGALRQETLRGLVTYGAIGQVGFAVVGLGAMTREGMAACFMQTAVHGLVAALALLWVESVESRLGTGELAMLHGKLAGMPGCATIATVTLLGVVGTPGLAGFWGEFVAILGAFPVQRLLTVVVVLAATIAAGYQVRLLARLVSHPGDTKPSVASTRRDLDARDLAVFAPLVLLCMVIGCCPAPLFGLVQGGVSDMNQLVNPPGPDEIAAIPSLCPRAPFSHTPRSSCSGSVRS